MICRKSFQQMSRIISLTICKKNRVKNQCDKEPSWILIIHDRLCTDRSTLGSSTLGAVTRILSCLRSSRKCSFTQAASLRNIEPTGMNSSISSTSSLQNSNPKPQMAFRHIHNVSQMYGFVAILYPILKNA